jgi:pyridinium-3,5-biscarboxylic acid mononucleotide sulfurtransferase
MEHAVDTLATELRAKEARLHAIIGELGRVAVAFSGGVDSSYLLSACLDVLGRDRVLALTADSPLLPRAELETAREVAHLLGAEHRVVPFDDLAIPEVAANVSLRCYYCKRARFEALLALAKEANGAHLLHGENADDHLDYRPGMLAARELGVRAPLAEAGLTKAEIRQLSHRKGLPTWHHPAAACLATRFPTDTRLSREALERVEQAELRLAHILGSWHLRVRDHYPIARIELAPDELALAASTDTRDAIAEGLHALGYRYVTLDLDGYRTGSMNDQTRTLSPKQSQ